MADDFWQWWWRLWGFAILLRLWAIHNEIKRKKD